MNHPLTQINSYWIDKTKFINNIPQPSYIINDNAYNLSSTLPNVFLHVEPYVILPHLQSYLINNYRIIGF